MADSATKSTTEVPLSRQGASPFEQSIHTSITAAPEAGSVGNAGGITTSNDSRRYSSVPCGKTAGMSSPGCYAPQRGKSQKHQRRSISEIYSYEAYSVPAVGISHHYGSVTCGQTAGTSLIAWGAPRQP